MILDLGAYLPGRHSYRNLQVLPPVFAYKRTVHVPKVMVLVQHARSIGHPTSAFCTFPVESLQSASVGFIWLSCALTVLHVNLVDSEVFPRKVNYPL